MGNYWLRWVVNNIIYYILIKIRMSKIEELVYSAHEHGQRTQLLEKVAEIVKQNSRIQLEDAYDEAYSYIMKTK